MVYVVVVWMCSNECGVDVRFGMPDLSLQVSWVDVSWECSREANPRELDSSVGSKVPGKVRSFASRVSSSFLSSFSPNMAGGLLSKDSKRARKEGEHQED